MRVQPGRARPVAIGSTSTVVARGHRRVLASFVAATIVTAGCSSGHDPDPEAVARGEALYSASCVECHGGPTGGKISDMPPRHNAEGHTWHHADCLLTEIILDGTPPRAGTEGHSMPAFGAELTEAEVEATLTYIRTWWTDEQRQFQADVTATECAGR